MRAGEIASAVARAVQGEPACLTSPTPISPCSPSLCFVSKTKMLAAEGFYYGNYSLANGDSGDYRSRMVTNCLPVSAHQFDAAVERAAL